MREWLMKVFCHCGLNVLQSFCPYRAHVRVFAHDPGCCPGLYMVLALQADRAVR